MLPYLGFESIKGHVCKLKRSLYSPKQASIQWNAKLAHNLLPLGFRQLWQDYSLFVKIKMLVTMTANQQ